MRTCPYCAEEIPEDSVTCRYCGGALAPVGGSRTPAPPGGTGPTPAPVPPGGTGPTPAPVPPGGSAPTAALPPPPSAAGSRPEDRPIQFSHSGERYLLGYSADAFAIWDRLHPDVPVRRFPRTDDGWRQAWSAYAAMEPRRAEVGIGAPSPTLGPRPSAPARAGTVNGAWWLLPILLGWLGGLIAWLVNKDTNEATARAMLFVGIGISLLGALLVALALPSVDLG